jgi:HSP20 family protein
MYDKDKRSFFERLTGTMDTEEETKSSSPQEYDDEPTQQVTEEVADDGDAYTVKSSFSPTIEKDSFEFEDDKVKAESRPEDEQEGELAVDVYEDGEDIYVQAMVAGVDPEDIDVQITREMVNLKGRRVNPSSIDDESYFLQELYWGGFSRRILLPEEIDPERSQALEKHGLLILKLPKLNKKRQQKLEVRSID